MNPIYVFKLGLIIKQTNVGVEKINKLPLKTYKIVIDGFTPQKLLKRVQFF